MLPPDHGQAKHRDPATAKAAASLVKPGSARYKLLAAHDQHPSGLSDEEAAIYAGLPLVSEYATRCSELQRAGYLENTTMTSASVSSGMSRMVRRITVKGQAVFARDTLFDL